MPRRSSESASGHRRYRWQGREYTSVTTILGNGVPKQQALVPWAAKAVAEWTAENFDQVKALMETDPGDAIQVMKGAHYKAKKAAGLKGTEIHALAEAHAKGEPLPPVSPAAAEYVPALMEFLEDWRPDPVLTEVTVFSLTHGYAGTLDSVADFDDEKLGRRILDFKTSKGVYGETALQLAALQWADGYDDPSNRDRVLVPMPKVDGGLVVHISPTGYALYLADIGREVFEAFLAAKTVAHFTTDLSKQVLTAI